MTELGSRLKEARTAKGYSIEDVQEITKIQKRYLTSIEDGNYTTMPGAFYVRAFIKQYAEAVGLNGDELLETYKAEIPSPSNDEVSKSIPVTPPRRSLGGRSSNKLMEFFPMLVVALFVIAIIVIVWTLYQKSPINDPEEIKTDSGLTLEQKPPQKEEVVLPEDEEEEDKPEEEQPQEEEPEKVQELVLVETQGATTTYQLSGAETYALKVVAVNNTWLNIRDQDNKILYDKGLQPGETYELDVSSLTQVRVRVGSTPGNTVYINDQVVEFPTEIVTQNLVIQFNK